MRLATNTPMDKLLEGGIEDDAITNVYGPPGSGKTNIVLAAALACVRTGKKVVYMDTEGSFSTERFVQMGGTEEDMKKIIFIHVHEWSEQHSEMLKVEKAIDIHTGLVAVDSMVALYRLELDEKNFPLINKQLATQYSILSRITRTKRIPIIITNQVYSHGESTELTSRAIAKYWSKTLVELRKTEKENQRVAILRKHRNVGEGRSIEFLIVKDGLKQVGRFNIL
jgi:DNA repair protein RadB